MTLVGETTVTFVAAAPPMLTLVAPVRLVPVIVTDVPPVVGPEKGLIPSRVGSGATTARDTVAGVDVPSALVAV